MKLRSRLLAVLSALIGLALFFSVLKQTGWGEIWANVRSLGWGFLLILAISATRYLSRSLAWLRCMTPAERGVGFWALWRARLAGEAIGDLTFGPVVAEPLRLVALGDKLSLSAGVSSLAVENISYTVSSCVLVLAGAAALLASFALEESLRAALLSALALVGLIILAAFVIINRQWPLGSELAARLSRLLVRDQARGAWLGKKIAHLRALEDYVFDFYAKRPGDFLLLVLCHAAFHLAGVLEIFVTLHLLGVELSFATAFMLEAINRAINIAFIFVPALVGVDEAGTGLVMKTLGFSFEAGVTLAVVRKIRMFCWIAVGLALLLASRAREKNGMPPHA